MNAGAGEYDLCSCIYVIILVLRSCGAWSLCFHKSMVKTDSRVIKGNINGWKEKIRKTEIMCRTEL